MSYFLDGYKSAKELTDHELSLISGGEFHDGDHVSTIKCYTIGTMKVCEHKVDEG